MKNLRRSSVSRKNSTMVWLETCSRKMLISLPRLSTARRSVTSSRPLSMIIWSAWKSSHPRWNSRNTRRFSMTCVAKTLSSSLIRGQLRRSPQPCSNSQMTNTRVKCWACATPSSARSWTRIFKSRPICSIVWLLSTQSRNRGPR